MKNQRAIFYGIVGGGGISKMHLAALAGETNVHLAAGCFSRKSEYNLQLGCGVGLPEDRIYKDYEEMARKEAERREGIDFVVIAAPNETHYAVAKEFLRAGIHVVCEKPLCFTTEQGRKLEQLAKLKGLLFAVTYTYVGYSMVKMARQIVLSGGIGKLLNISSEYLQSWLLGQVSGGEDQPEVWRMDPEKAGFSCAVGDIGTHIEELVAYVTGMRPKRLACVMDRYGMRLELSANIIAEFENNIHGHFCCSQVSAGYANGLSFRIFGTEGSVEWRQESPNELKVTRRGYPSEIYSRDIGAVPLRCFERYTNGRQETIVDAFANIYRSFLGELHRRKFGFSANIAEKADFPTVKDGVAGVRFIEAAVESDRNHGAWAEV